MGKVKGLLMQQEEEEGELLRVLADGKVRGAYTACDGTYRAIARRLESKGLAEWKGSNWGSSFYVITNKGLEALG